MKNQKLHVLLGALVSLIACGNLQAAEAESCAAIDNAEERLVCYDSLYNREGTVEEAEVAEPLREDSEHSSVTAEAQESVIAAEQDAGPLQPEPVAAGAVAETAVAEEERKTGFLGDERVNLTTTIRAIRSGEKQKMVFLLDNNEIWMQSSPRSLPFSEGDTVTIKNALLGGYYMRSEKGTSTRVQRISQ